MIFRRAKACELVALDKSLPLSQLPIAVIDLETTGMDVMRDRILSFGGLYLREETELELLINPKMRIPKQGYDIHGISEEMISDKGDFAENWEAIESFLKGRVIVGHHINFDISFLHRQAKDAGFIWRPSACLDTGLLMAAWHKFPSQQLDAMAAHYNIDLSERHSALGDAEIAESIFLCLMKEMGDLTLSEALALQMSKKRLIAAQKHEGWWDWKE